MGAVALVPDHAPMNELVTPGNGVLMRHGGAFSQDGPPLPALAAYGNISVRMSAEVGVGLCVLVYGGWLKW